MIYNIPISSHKALHHSLLQICTHIIQSRFVCVSKFLTTTIFLIAFSYTTYSQPENNNWLIDGDNWIDFNSGVPVVREPLEFSTIEAAASISDSLGNLLFYTNGIEVYNRLGGVMTDVEVELDDTTWYKSYTQGVLILPWINYPHRYRIIGIGNYADVDISLNGGLGGMLTEPAWRPFDLDIPGWSEKNVAVKHGNGTDWWVIQMRSAFNLETESWDSSFAVYRSDNDGVYLHYNTQINTRYQSSATVYREMSFSQKGDLLAIVFGTSLSIHEFDRCNGVFGTEVLFLDGFSNLYGCAFSPSGRYLYFNASSGFVFGDNILYQLDLEPDQFGNHALTEIYRREEYGTFANGQLELGPDGKVYMAVGCRFLYCGLSSPLNMNLGVINSPDLPGLSCDFDTLGLYLEGRRTGTALPNTVNYSLRALEGSECDTLNNTTAIQSIETLAIQWQVFPTLSSGRFTFSGPANALFSVSDVWGRSVPYERLSDNEFDLGALPAGIYLIQASHHNEQQTFKLLKQ